MPWNYKCQTEKYNPDKLQIAINKVNEGASIRCAAKTYGISWEMLRCWVTTETTKAWAGRKRVLTDEKEELIIIALEKCSALAWPWGTEEITMMIKIYLDRMGKKTVFNKDNLPDKDWVISFKRHWQDQIHMRKPEVLTKAWAQNLNQQTLDKFFDMLLEILNSNGFHADADVAARIFNANESGFSTDPTHKKMLFKKSSKDS